MSPRAPTAPDDDLAAEISTAPGGGSDATMSAALARLDGGTEAYGVARLPRSRAPSYRVVELTRGRDGRLRREGRIWQPSLDATRRFARLLAACGAGGGRVLVADAAGRVLEELPVQQPAASAPAAVDWRTAPLPPLPAVPPRAPLPGPRRAASSPGPEATPAVAPDVDLALEDGL
ncbi:MAG: hypothetical protein MUF03_07520 [Rubrivivax sp.]|jgi:hypothetical protein|nr:hypothetical protein [Rubrivivax sp.]